MPQQDALGIVLRLTEVSLILGTAAVIHHDDPFKSRGGEVPEYAGKFFIRLVGRHNGCHLHLFLLLPYRIMPSASATAPTIPARSVQPGRVRARSGSGSDTGSGSGSGSGGR